MDKRRRIHYIDKIFQNKFIFIFLLFSVLAAAINLWFMFFVLKHKVEDHIYQSHISINNVKEIVMKDLFEFNAFFFILVAVVAVIFYSLIRFRIQVYFEKVYVALFKRLSTNSSGEFKSDLPNQFQDVNTLLEQFFRKIDRKLIYENNLYNIAKHYIDNPTDDNLKKFLEITDDT